MTDKIHFTPEKAKDFKRMYDTAAKTGMESFTYEGHTILTSYARYVVEYLRIKKLL